jgi:hypothetical protein
LSKDICNSQQIFVLVCVLYHHKSAAAWFAPLAKREEPNGHARVATCGNHLRHSVSNWLDRRFIFARVGVGVDQPNVIGPTRACRSTSIRLLLVKVQLALYCQHVPSRRHFLKFLSVMWVHQHLGKFPAFFREPVVFQYSLHDAIPQSIKTAG